MIVKIGKLSYDCITQISAQIRICLVSEYSERARTRRVGHACACASATEARVMRSDERSRSARSELGYVMAGCDKYVVSS